MKVVFVIPPFDYAWSIGSPYRRARNGILPPLGVGFLAAALEARGHEAVLVDAMAERFNIDQTAEAVAALNPGLIGLSVMTCLNAPAALETARALRRRCPGVPLAAGGPYVTGRGPAFLEDCPEAECAVPGDGEIPLCALADALTAGSPLEDCPGLWLRNAEGTPTATPAAPFVKDLDSFAPPGAPPVQAGPVPAAAQPEPGPPCHHRHHGARLPLGPLRLLPPGQQRRRPVPAAVPGACRGGD